LINRKLLFFLNSFLFFLYIVVIIVSESYILEDSTVSIAIILTFLLCSGTVYLFFSNAIRTNDYTLLAGYNPKKKYNYDVLAKMLGAIINVILWHTLVFSLLIVVLSLLGSFKGILPWLLIISYIIDILVVILVSNFKYKKHLCLD